MLTDRPALPGAEALWAAHVARAVAQVGRLRVGLPRPALPRATRGRCAALLVVALAACLVIAGERAPPRLLRARAAGLALPPAPPATQLQAWITPPAYTGLAPLFLRRKAARSRCRRGRT